MKFVNPSRHGKELQSKVFDAASKGEITAYVKHKKTGAMLPVDSEIIRRMNNGESFDLAAAERKHNRRFFKVEKLTERWDMESDAVVAILQSFEVPCFFKSDEVEHDEFSAKVGCNDICVFEEYVLAIEKKRKLKKRNVNSRYVGFNTN